MCPGTVLEVKEWPFFSASCLPARRRLRRLDGPHVQSRGELKALALCPGAKPSWLNFYPLEGYTVAQTGSEWFQPLFNSMSELPLLHMESRTQSVRHEPTQA
jgi:hypothetical protein